MSIVGERKYYNCYSINQMKFLQFNGLQPYKKMKHDGTGKDFWIYVRNEKLNLLLNEWSSNKAKFLQPTA